MKDPMFCPRCGVADQTPDSYCRQCGEWLPDLSSGRIGGRFGTTSREQKIRKMRILQFVSIGMSLAATAIVVTFLASGRDPEMLGIAALFGFLVTVYQVITLVLGYKVLAPKQEREQAPVSRIDSAPNHALRAANTAEFIKPDSVVENTTELLDPVPVRRAEHPER